MDTKKKQTGSSDIVQSYSGLPPSTTLMMASINERPRPTRPSRPTPMSNRESPSNSPFSNLPAYGYNAASYPTSNIRPYPPTVSSTNDNNGMNMNMSGVMTILRQLIKNNQDLMKSIQKQLSEQSRIMQTLANALSNNSDRKLK